MAFGVLIAAGTLQFGAQGYVVSGSCMQPHLYTGERVIASKLSYLFGAPHRGDIVVFRFPMNPAQLYVKRIIGMPGDTVAIQSGTVFIDGRPLREPYVVNTPHGSIGGRTVPAGSYFVMGDNRDESDDSRYWGDLPRRNIIGRAVACYWPLYKWSVLR